MRFFPLFVLGTLLCLTALPSPARSQETSPASQIPPVQVRLASLGTPERVVVRPGAGLLVTNTATAEPVAVPAGPVTLSAQGQQVELNGTLLDSARVEAETLSLSVGKLVRVYNGALLVTAAKGRLTLVSECDLETYTEGVLAGECPALFHAEAIRAMAVAVRTYSYRKVFLGKGDLCDTTHCQVYRGSGTVRPQHREAVAATSGLCALYQGQAIDAVYSSDCGGYTEANEDAWKGARPVPYLRPVEDAPEPQGEPFCAINRSHRWTLTLPRPRLLSLLGKTAEQVRLELLELTTSGRVRTLQLAPPAAEESVEPKPQMGMGMGMLAGVARLFSGEQWRRLLGAGELKSLKFSVRIAPQGVTLEGRGYGHGVGLCQFGAHGMGRQGFSFKEILQHYYTGIEIGPAPPVTGPAPRSAAAPSPRRVRSR